MEERGSAWVKDRDRTGKNAEATRGLPMPSPAKRKTTGARQRHGRPRWLVSIVREPFTGACSAIFDQPDVGFASRRFRARRSSRDAVAVKLTELMRTISVETTNPAFFPVLRYDYQTRINLGKRCRN
jgi:hypothetical protein